MESIKGGGFGFLDQGNGMDSCSLRSLQSSILAGICLLYLGAHHERCVLGLVRPNSRDRHDKIFLAHLHVVGGHFGFNPTKYVFIDRRNIISGGFNSRLPQLFQLRWTVGFRKVERSLLAWIEEKLETFDWGILVSLGTPGKDLLVFRIVANMRWHLWLFEAFKAWSLVRKVFDSVSSRPPGQSKTVTKSTLVELVKV